MKTTSGLKRRLGKAFVLQAVFISLSAFLGVYAAGILLKEVLIKQALRNEAVYFWEKRDVDARFPLPNTANLTGYMEGQADSAAVPTKLQALEPGFHDITSQFDFSVVYVTDKAGQRLYLVFHGERATELATYFGLFPLAGVLIVLYLSAWLAYRMTRRAVSPIIWLADEVNKLDPEDSHATVLQPERLPHGSDQEIRVLATAISQFQKRLGAFVERERNFTRDASHELRSPLTVIKLAADVLLAGNEIGESARDSVKRIRRAATDMQELTQAFLLLARESSGNGLSMGPVCVNDVVAEEVQRAKLLAGDKPVAVEQTAECRLVVLTSEKVLSVMIGNLVRNALSYTDAGCVRVHVGRHAVSIQDSGIGIPEDKVAQVFRPYFRSDPRRRGGHGVGLTIVKRLSDRFQWPIEIESRSGAGTRVVVRFPGGSCERLEQSETSSPAETVSSQTSHNLHGVSTVASRDEGQTT